MDHHIHIVADCAQVQANRLAQPPANAVALYGCAHGSRNREAHARRTGAPGKPDFGLLGWWTGAPGKPDFGLLGWWTHIAVPPEEKHRHVRGKNPPAAAVHLLEVGVLPQPGLAP